MSWHQVVRPTVAGAFEIPVTEGDLGDVYVNVVLLRDGRLLQSERRLAVPPVSRTLQIALTPDRPVAKPQEPASFAVQVTDAGGQPVRASVSLAVIDESVFGVKADDTPDPARVFYRREYSRVEHGVLARLLLHGLLGHRAAAAGVAAPAAAVAGRLQGRPAGPAAGAQGVPRRHSLGGIAGDRRRGARPHRRALSRFAHDVAADRPRRHHRHAGRRRRRPHDDDQGPRSSGWSRRGSSPRATTVATPTLVHNYLDAARETRVEVQADRRRPRAAPRRRSPAPSTPTASAAIPGASPPRRPGAAVFTATASTGTDRRRARADHPGAALRGEAARCRPPDRWPAAARRRSRCQVPATANPSARTVRVSLAPSMAGALLGAADSLDQLPVRLHRADAVELHPQPRRDPRARPICSWRRPNGCRRSAGR